MQTYMHIYVHISPMRRGHAHLLCAIPTLTNDPTHVCIYVCIYVYVYIDIYIYVCIYVYVSI